MGEQRYSSSILDFGTRWRWVVSFTPRPLYSREKSPRYILGRRLGEPQSSSGCYGEEKNLVPRRKSNAGRPARSLSLYQQSYSNSHSCVYTGLKIKAIEIS
jgi:hypothetical protein